jgi:dihydrolipoamide dehydrogenase
MARPTKLVMKSISVDVAVIGAGTAGLAAYRAATARHKHTVLIEGGVHGTTCARVGCMPSKLLIAAADAAHATVRWPQFGLQLDGTVRADGRAVMERVKRERDRFVGFVLEGVAAMPTQDRILGNARFIDDRTLQLDDHMTIAFGSAVIATGSMPSVAPFLRGLGDRLVVNDDVFDWDDLPQSVAIFGPGVIGLELRQALHRLGVRVLLFGRSGQIGPFSDPEVRAYATRTFAAELTLDASAEIRSIERSGNTVVLRYRGPDGAERSDSVDYVIAATGREPNVRGLGLDRTTLALDGSGVPLFDRNTMQCGTQPIFIAGDARMIGRSCTKQPTRAHRRENAARFPDLVAGLRRTPLGIVFTDPQLAMTGARHADLAPGTFVSGVVSFENQGRSRMMLRNVGLLHVYVDIATGRIVGAEMIGPDAEHLAHLLAWAIQADMTVSSALEMPFYHPVIEEGLRTALRDAKAKVNAARVRVAA